MKNISNFKSYLKFLGKNKFYTFVEVLGFSISLMFIIVIAIYTQQELSIDQFHKNKERIYVLGNEMALASAYGIGERLMDRFPEIEDVISISSGSAWGDGDYLTITCKSQKVNAKIQYTYERFFDFFDFPLTTGEKKQVLKDLNSAVISESFARAVFGEQDPIGQTIDITPDIAVYVSGIMKDIDNSVIPYCDILLRMEKLTERIPEMNPHNYDNAFNSMVFLLAKPNSNLTSKVDNITSYLKEFYAPYEMGFADKTLLIPLSEAYFKNESEFSLLNRGDKKFVLIIFSVGLLILIFAVTNYINLTVAQTGARAKEVAMRSLLGEKPQQLFSRLIIESTLLCFLSFLVGCILAIISIPYVNNLLETKINFLDAISISNISISILFILLLGVFVGLIPAFQIMKMKAIDVVKGEYRMKTKMTFSKIFITFQNTITIGMIVAAIVMMLQINHLIKAPLAYKTDNIIDIKVLEIKDRNILETFSKELEALACVKKVGLCRGTPFSAGMNYTMEIEGKSISFQGFEFNQEAVDILGIQILKDNYLANGEGYFLNEYAFQELNFDENSKSFPFFGYSTPIAGMIKNFQLGNITYQQSPVLLHILKNENVQLENILVEFDGDPHNAYKEIEKIYNKIIQSDFPGKFIDQHIKESFASQQKTYNIVRLFAFIAIVISLLGLFAIATYFIHQRSREISLRKVFGSNNQQIMKLMIRSFLNYVLIAFFIATPFIWYMMHQWLSDYAYRISLSPFIFIAGGAFCLLSSLFIVFGLCYQAANKNPVENLKAE